MRFYSNQIRDKLGSTLISRIIIPYPSYRALKVKKCSFGVVLKVYNAILVSLQKCNISNHERTKRHRGTSRKVYQSESISFKFLVSSHSQLSILNEIRPISNTPMSLILYIRLCTFSISWNMTNGQYSFLFCFFYCNNFFPFLGAKVKYSETGFPDLFYKILKTGLLFFIFSFGGKSEL